jgi:hypothetical protein
MINGVELQMTKKFREMRNLDDRHTVLGQDMLDAANEAMQIGHVSQHMACQKQPGRPMLVAQSLSGPLVEKIHHGRNAVLDGSGGNVLGRLDAEHGHSLPTKLLEHGAVVAGGFHHQVVTAQVVAAAEKFAQPTGVRSNQTGSAGHVDVVLE